MAVHQAAAEVRLRIAEVHHTEEAAIREVLHTAEVLLRTAEVLTVEAAIRVAATREVLLRTAAAATREAAIDKITLV